MQEKRKTINGDDLLWAMSTLGFDKYVEPLKLYLSKYREAVRGDKPEKGGGGSGGGAGDDLLLRLLRQGMGWVFHRHRRRVRRVTKGGALFVDAALNIMMYICKLYVFQ